MAAPITSEHTDTVISPREVRESLRRNIIAGSLGMIWMAAAYGMPLPMLMDSIGASGLMIGLLTTVRGLAMVAQVPGALLAQRCTSRRDFWRPLSLMHRSVWFLPAILPLLFPDRPAFLPVLMLGVVAVSDLLAHLGAPAWHSWMADLIPSKTCGRFWSTRHSYLTASNLLGMFAMGWALDAFPGANGNGASNFGFFVVFAAATLFGLADILLHARVREPEHIRSNGFSWDLLFAPFQKPGFRQLTTAMGAWSFVVGMVGAFSMVYLKREWNVSYMDLAVVSIAAALGAVISGFALGHLIDRLGARPLLVFFMVAATLAGVAWFFVGPGTIHVAVLDRDVSLVVVVIGVASFFAGAFHSGVLLCQLRMTAALSVSEGRTLAMGMHWSVVGLLGAAGPALGGFLMDILPGRLPNWVMPMGGDFSWFQVLMAVQILLSFVVVVPLALRIQSQAGDAALGTVARILVLNPLQAVRNIYNMNMIAAPGSIQSRTEVVKSLGKSKSLLAVQDLVEQLEDPSHEVREEAIRALGYIGGPDAEEALLARLHDPMQDLRPLMARALGEMRDPRAFEIMRHELRSKDADMVVESARALGRLGNIEAASALLDLMFSSVDSRIIGAAAAALGELKHFPAAGPIFEQITVAENPVLKRKLCIAAGELFGEPEGFYRIVLGEARQPGSEMDRLLAQIRRTVRRLLGGKSGENEVVDMLERISETYEAGDPQKASKAVERFFSALWEAMESRNLGTGKMHLAGRFIRALANRESRLPQDSHEVLLGVYLLLQTIPVHPLLK